MVQDPDFARAIELLDAGDVGEIGGPGVVRSGLRAHLDEHPDLVRIRITVEGPDYFRHPSLLDFVAENPIRHGTLPTDIVEIARVILDAGGDREINSTLDLVCSGRVARECDVQTPLIDLLCERGADPDHAMLAAVAHGEFAAVERLLHHGAEVDLAVAAATGRAAEARRQLPTADSAQRHLALAFAAQFGYVELVRLLLDAGEDPDRYNPDGAHSHATPLHQAALAGHYDVVELLVSRGARLDLRDVQHHGTPLGWAQFAGQDEVAALLRSHTSA